MWLFQLISATISKPARLWSLMPPCFFCECKSPTFFCPPLLVCFFPNASALALLCVPDSTPSCKSFSWGSPRTWPTVTLRPAVRWRTVILVITMLGMTTHHGLCSRQVRLIRQAGELQCLQRDWISEFGVDLTVIFWRTLLLSPGSATHFLLSSAQNENLLQADTVLCFLVSQS